MGLCTSVLLVIVLLLGQIPLAPVTKLAQLAWYGTRALIGLAFYATSAWVIKLHELELLQNKAASWQARLEVTALIICWGSCIMHWPCVNVLRST